MKKLNYIRIELEYRVYVDGTPINSTLVVWTSQARSGDAPGRYGDA